MRFILLRVVWRHAITILILQWEHNTLALVARRPVRKIQHLMMVHINVDLTRLTFGSFADEVKDFTPSSTNQVQYSFPFSVLMGNKVTDDWSTMGLKKRIKTYAGNGQKISQYYRFYTFCRLAVYLIDKLYVIFQLSSN